MPTAASPETRLVVFTAFDDFQVLDVTGPHEVFSMANRFAWERDPDAPPPYRLEVRSSSGSPIRTSSGLVFQPDRPLGAASSKANAGIHTLLVPGGNGTIEAGEAIVPWLREVAPRCERVTSVCSGALMLAAAGLLDGKRATTHWTVCEIMADLFPGVLVDPDPIFVRDGNVWTSAGVTAGIDLALALVDDDLGPDLAHRIARYLVMFVQRPGGQAQFSTQLASTRARRSPLRELQGWIADHIDEDLSVSALARRVHMSVRHFSRVFRDDVGVTPAEYVERVRVEAARNVLASSTDSVEVIARRCGFGTPETMQRSFRRVVGVTPTAYRRHFHRDTA